MSYLVGADEKERNSESEVQKCISEIGRAKKWMSKYFEIELAD